MQAIVFDLDGTLVDSRHSILESIDFAINELGLTQLTIDRRLAVRQDLASSLRQAADRAGLQLSESTISDFIQTYRDHHSTNPHERMAAFEGVKEGLLTLKKTYRLAVATTKTTHQARIVLDSLDLSKFFEAIQGTDPGLRYKPAPDILHKVADDLEIHQSVMAYVGDSAHDLEAAHAAKMKSVGVLYGYSDEHELQRVSPFALVRRFDEILHLFK